MARPYWVSLRERASVRTKLLDTARALIAREGEEALTLGAVAEEAGLAHATVYGYFSGKRDLLGALKEAGAPSPVVPLRVAEAPAADPAGPGESQIDLFERPHAPSTTPPAEVGDAPPEAGPQPAMPLAAGPAIAGPASSAETKADEPSEEAAAAAVFAVAAPDAVPVPANDILPATGERTEKEEVPPPSAPVREDIEAPAPAEEGELRSAYEIERRQQAADLEEIARRLMLPEGALKEGTDAVISRLETRLRVLERAIANLEARQNAAADSTDKKIKPVSDLVAQLRTRADASEERLRHALAELRLNIHELSAKQAAMGGNSAAVPVAPPEWPDPLPDFNPPRNAPAAAEAPESAAGESEASSDKARNDYLSAARNLAKEGARQAAERESLEEEEQNHRRRRLLTAAGIAAVCLVLVGVLFRLNPASHGVSPAQSKIAEAPAHPAHGVPRAPLDRLADLANKGNVAAELLVGLKYLKGEGVPANDKLAALWLMRAANAGNAVAENNLGALYQAGRGVPRDLERAVRLYESAAAKGDRHAMSNLAVLHASGAGVPVDFAEAARWFQKSASLGFVDAQFNLAVLFERGDGLPQSLLDAYKWYSIAARAGDAVAKARAEAIATQVSAEELAAARQAVANFKPQPLDPKANDVPSVTEVLAQR